MLLKDLSEEFKFNCQCRRLSVKTTDNYQNQISYLLIFLEKEYHVNLLYLICRSLTRLSSSRLNLWTIWITTTTTVSRQS